ncbi:helix-turn-helix domain-containing protein [Paenibacillus sp. HB172176]|uniref:helix-turn-helix domain-containing protein n=1 Tax=Paenibacillus sp. HB172176 TaxID=2493690 RepID=UPI00143AFA7F|nr:helix-turn-helix domain-containing protein [Paenibacillus sp. HB172176]
MSNKKLLLLPRNKSVALKWFISYLIVLVIPILFALYLYHDSEKIVRGQMNESSVMILKEMKDTFDNQLNEMGKIATQIAFNPKVQMMVSKQASLTPREEYMLVELLDDFKVYKAANSTVEDFFVYFHHQDIVVSSNNKFRTNHLSIFLDDLDIDMEEWDGLVGNSTMEGYGALEKPDGSKLVFYKQSLPFRQTKDPDVTIAAVLDNKSILQYFDYFHDEYQGIVYILNDQGRTLLSSQSEPLPFDASRLTSEANGFHSNEYVVSYIKSTNTPFTYVIAIPESVFQQKLHAINKTAIAALVLAIILGLLMVLWLVSKQYKPVRSIMSQLSKNKPVSHANTDNEWEMIESMLGETLEENSTANQRLHRQRKVIESNLLERVIKGRIEGQEMLEDILSGMDFEMASEEFMIFIIYIENYELDLVGDREDDARDWDLVRLIISNITEELLNPVCRQIMFEVDDLLVGLINVPPSQEGVMKDDRDPVIAKLRESQKFIQNRFNIQYSVSYSGLHRTISSIPSAYEEAMQAMEYKFLLGTSQMIDFESFKKSEPEYFYSLEQEQWLVNYIKAGDYESAKKLVDQLVHLFGSAGNVSIEVVKCFMFDITSTIIKATEEIQMNKEEIVNQTINDLLHCRTIVEMQDKLLQLLKKMTDFIQEKKSGGDEELKNQILSFIEERYSDNDLSVSSIAESFHKDPVYLSKYFRKYEEDGILDAINRVRLQAAKIQLIETGKTIKEIANDVGYYNSNAFIRIFKKYEGITPGKYRESNE